MPPDNDPAALELVSILLPVFNGERYLSQCLDSLLNQTYTNLEFVIVDDGSIDNSREILLQYAQADSRIRLHFLSHSGLVTTLNYGLKKCRGRYIARMDADDISLPERIERLMHRLSKCDVLALGSFISIIDDEGVKHRVGKAPVGGLKLKKRLMHSSCMFHPTVIYKKDSVLAVGGYRDEFPAAEDYDLWLRLAQLGNLENLPEVLLLYRVHSESVSATKIEQQALSSAAALAAFYVRHSKGSEEKYLKELRSIKSISSLLDVCPPEVKAYAHRAYFRSIIYGARFAAEDISKIVGELISRREYLATFQDRVDCASILLRFLIVLLRKSNYRAAGKLITQTLIRFPVEVVYAFFQSR